MAKFTEQAVSIAFQPYLQTGESLTNAAHCIYVARFLPLGLIRALFTKFYIVGLTNQRVIILSLANRFGGNVNVAEVRGYPLDRLPVINATFGTFATGLRINDPAAPFRATFASVGVPGNYQRGQMIAKELLERWQNKGAIEVSRENFDQAKFETPKSQILPQSTPSSAAPAQFGQPTVVPQYQPQQTSGTLYGCLSAALIAAGSGLLLLSTLVIVAMILDKTKTTRDTIGGIVGGGTMILFSVSLIGVGIYVLRLRRTAKSRSALPQSSSAALSRTTPGQPAPAQSPLDRIPEGTEKKSESITIYARDEQTAHSLCNDEDFLFGVLMSEGSTSSKQFMDAWGKGGVFSYDVTPNLAQGGYDVRITLTSQVRPAEMKAKKPSQAPSTDEDAIDRKAEMFREMGFTVGGVEAVKEAARKAAAARPDGPWFDEAIDKIVSVYREHPQGFVQGFGGPPEQELRRIGEMLNDRGGMDLMRAAHAEFSRRCDVRGASRNLEFIWDGIGTWQG